MHDSHVTRFSDSSLYDEVCVNCGTTDGHGGKLAEPCPSPGRPHASESDYRAWRETTIKKHEKRLCKDRDA